MNKTALITGASSGIGKALAHQFAKNNYDLVLVAEKPDQLSQAADELRSQHQVQIYEIPEDLTKDHASQHIYQQVQTEGLQIDVLVNDAGVGQKEHFHKSDIDKDLYIVNLNIIAMMRLTKLFVKDMVARGDGKILNLGSVAGFQPGPLLAVYHASKAFVVSFSEAISEELEGTGVSVTALCPGPTDTNFFDRADMENARILDISKVMEPEEVAEIGYQALMDKERVVIPGMSNKILTFTRRLIPQKLQATMHKKFYEVNEEHGSNSNKRMLQVLATSSVLYLATKFFTSNGVKTEENIPQHS